MLRSVLVATLSAVAVFGVLSGHSDAEDRVTADSHWPSVVLADSHWPAVVADEGVARDVPTATADESGVPA
jgi:hypothetical protein